MLIPVRLATTTKLPFAVKQKANELLAGHKPSWISIIPAYGRLKYLQLAVRAALKQSNDGHEEIISQNPKPHGLDPAIKQ